MGTILGLATVATTGAYGDLSGKPTLGTAADNAETDFATAAQGTLATNALPKAGGTMTGAVAGNLIPIVTRGAGSTQPGAADSGAWITTDGNITIPNANAGWHCTLEFDGDRVVTFNGQTWDPNAAPGDIYSVVVKSSSSIRITPRIAVADVIDEGNFS